jgi:hypothetical protein
MYGADSVEQGFIEQSVQNKMGQDSGYLSLAIAQTFWGLLGEKLATCEQTNDQTHSLQQARMPSL